MAVGLRRSTRRGSVLIWGSLGFVWLFALRSCEWMNIGLVGSIPTPFAACIEDQWGDLLVPPANIPSHSWDLGLIGTTSKDFASTLWSQTFNGPRLVWFSDSPRRPFSLKTQIGGPPDCRFQRCQHSAVGGVTTDVTTFASLSLPDFVLPLSVPRTLSSVIDHKRYLPAGSAQESDLHLSDRLHPRRPFQSILIPSRFSPSGYGRRSLSFHELCLAWDMPLWSLPPRVPKQFFTYVSSWSPIKSLTAMVDAALSVVPLSDGSSLGLSPLPSLILPFLDPRGTWLPSLQAWLPPTWIDSSLVTEKAVKVDDSNIPTHLWDLRISLVLHSPISLVDRLRTFMHSIACRRVCRSLCRYLRTTHGDLWTAWVTHSVNGGVPKNVFWRSTILPLLSFATSRVVMLPLPIIAILLGGNGFGVLLYFFGDGHEPALRMPEMVSRSGSLLLFQNTRENKNI